MNIHRPRIRHGLTIMIVGMAMTGLLAAGVENLSPIGTMGKAGKQNGIYQN